MGQLLDRSMFQLLVGRVQVRLRRWRRFARYLRRSPISARRLKKRLVLPIASPRWKGTRPSFTAEVVTLAQELNVPLTSGEVLDLAAAIEDRVQRAKAARSGRAEKQEHLKRTQEKQRALLETIAIHDKRKAEVMAFFGAGSLAEVGVALQRIESKGRPPEAGRACYRRYS